MEINQCENLVEVCGNCSGSGKVLNFNFKLGELEEGTCSVCDGHGKRELFCACGKPATQHFPEEENHWQYQCDDCAEEEKRPFKENPDCWLCRDSKRIPSMTGWRSCPFC
jgi:hypothetical protein